MMMMMPVTIADNPHNPKDGKTTGEDDVGLELCPKALSCNIAMFLIPYQTKCLVDECSERFSDDDDDAYDGDGGDYNDDGDDDDAWGVPSQRCETLCLLHSAWSISTLQGMCPLLYRSSSSSRLVQSIHHRIIWNRPDRKT